MASAFAVPLMSTVESSQYIPGHSHKRSHQRSTRRLTPPFGLPRIPSERLDPGSISFNHNSTAHKDGEEHKDGNLNFASIGANGSIPAPSLSMDWQNEGVTKRESASPNPDANGSLQSQGYGHPHPHLRTAASASKMRLSSG